MLVLEWKERAFIEKVNSRCFCWFPAAILVHQNCTPIWRLHTKLYKSAWNVSANNSETVGHKDLRLWQIVYVLSFITFHFLGFSHWTVSNLFLCSVTVKTIYSLENRIWENGRTLTHRLWDPDTVDVWFFQGRVFLSGISYAPATLIWCHFAHDSCLLDKLPISFGMDTDSSPNKLAERWTITEIGRKSNSVLTYSLLMHRFPSAIKFKI